MQQETLSAQLALLGILTRSHAALLTRIAPGRLRVMAQSPLDFALDEFLLKDREIPTQKIPIAARAVDSERVVKGPYGVMVKDHAVQEWAFPVAGKDPTVIFLQRSLNLYPIQNFIPGGYLALKQCHEFLLSDLMDFKRFFRLPVSPFGLVMYNEEKENTFTSPKAGKILQKILDKKTPREALLADGFYESLGVPFEFSGSGLVRQTTLRTPPFLTSLVLIRKRGHGSLLVMTQRDEKTSSVPASELREKMVQEIHHRVKNNFQMATSLLQLQARQYKDEPHVVEALKAAQARLNSMAVVYQFLSQEGNHIIHLPGLLRQLSNQLAGQTWGKPAQVTVVCDIAFIKADMATKLAMVVTELVSNSLKHSRSDGEPPRIEVSAVQVGQQIVLTVADDGPGPPLDFELEKAKGLGLRIVKSIVEDDLGGCLSFSRKENQTRFTITLEKETPAGFAD